MTSIERADNFIASLGVEAYRVGGSVRDEILGRKPKDADYVVRGLTPSDLKARLVQARVAHSPLKLRNGVQVGWRVSKKGLGLIEIALPRTERSTGGGRHDFEIVVDPSLPLAEDAERRDFTFNALYRDMNGVIQDPLGGLNDLQHKMIRTTHSNSFRDDPLRVLRALRFVSTLGYDIDPSTWYQMRDHAAAVTGLTKDGHASGTVVDEMSKLLMGEHVGKALRLMRDSSVLAVLFPELEPMLGFEQGSRYHDLTTDEHTFKALETAAHVEAPLRVRWALLFHDAGKPEAAWIGRDGRLHYYSTEKTVVKLDGSTEKVQTEDHEVVSERLWREAAGRLNVPKRLRDDVAYLIRHHMVPLDKVKPSKVRLARVEHGDEMLRDLYLHRACDVSGKEKATAAALTKIAEMEQIRFDAQEDGVPAAVGDLAVTGKDAIDLGLRGPEIGRALRAVLREVAAQPDATKLSREWQLWAITRH